MEQKRKILIVDDSPTNVAILEEILNEYECQTAPTGEDALKIAPEFRPDLILLDIMMPGIDGYETCRKLRESPELRYVKIVMLSAKASIAERLKGYEVGADDYMAKSFDVDELLAKVKVFLRLKSVEEVDRLKTDFLRLLCMDTQNPLLSIIQPLDRLARNEEMTIDDRKSVIKKITQSTKQLQELFEKVMTLSTMKAGKFRYQFDQEDLCSVVREAVSEVKELADIKGVEIHQNLPDSANCKMDRIEMVNVVKTILGNAIRFSPSPSRVSVDLIDDSVCYRLAVKDYGKGISPDFIEQVYDEFTYVDVKEFTEWHGLSLPIAQRIVEEHSGWIDVKSIPGEETTFNVNLPILKSA